MYANKPSVPGLLDKLNVEIGSQYSHIYMVEAMDQTEEPNLNRLTVPSSKFIQFKKK